VATLALGVLVSGNGSNLQAILDAIQSGRLDASVKVVISNQPEAHALTRAANAGVPALVIPHRAFPSREAFDQAVQTALREAGVGWVVLAGFMRILTPGFIAAFRDRMVNVHPALLPAFPGAHAVRDALAYGVRVTGCTVHLVDEGVDSGPILAQRAVPVLDGDDEQVLGERIHRAEHALFVEVLSGLASGSIRVPAPRRVR
jgi:phosphoribosylglycinamide formyltransferase-1